MQEEWREVPGRPGYMVSNEGRAAKLLTLSSGTSGYVQYATPDGAGGRHREYLHSWVMLAFVGPRPEGMYVLHNDDVKTNNRVENLRYGTPSENVADMFRNGRRSLKTHCKFGHILMHPNLQSNGSCRACGAARKRATRLQVPCTEAMRDQVYEELMP